MKRKILASMTFFHKQQQAVADIYMNPLDYVEADFLDKNAKDDSRYFFTANVFADKNLSKDQVRLVGVLGLTKIF